jgi:photosystem II stability/assembly factor-like uncharacterized protein
MIRKLQIILIFIITLASVKVFPDWRIVKKMNNFAGDVQFINANTGWFTCANDSIYTTTNNGLNWISFNIGTHAYGDMHFVNSSTGFIATGNEIIKTINSGVNWYSSYDDCENDCYFYKLFMVNEVTGYAIADWYVYKTTNFGNEWYRIAGFGIRNTGFFLNQSTGWFFSTISVKKTTDGGVSWIQNKIDFNNFNKVFFINENTGWSVGGGPISDGAIKKTTNSGLNWITQKQAINHWFSDISFANENTGWAIGSEGIFRTTNGGNNWIHQLTPQSYFNYFNIYMKSSIEAYVTADSVLLYTSNGGVNIETISNEVPNHFFLKQNYPNPFNPATNIKFSIQKSGFVNLKVYDVNGKEIATLVNENLQAGEYQTSFTATGLPSGIYFYNMKTMEFTETKRMVLMK